MKRTFKIKKGDNVIDITIQLKLSEWKSIVNLLNETDPSMIGYHHCSKEIIEQIRLHQNSKNL